MTKFGIIGFGQFGQLLASKLKPYGLVLVHDLSPGTSERAFELGVDATTLIGAALQDIVIVAVPIQSMREVFRDIATYVRPGALVMDVGSVKVLPAQWMLDLLPENVDIVATHPLFGPQSAANGLAGNRLVVCNVRGNRAQDVGEFAERLGLIVNHTTPDEHDREMAHVQALTHLIGRTLTNMQIVDGDLKTPSYQHLLELCSLIGGDSMELFMAIQTLNPYAAEVSNTFVRTAASLLKP